MRKNKYYICFCVNSLLCKAMRNVKVSVRYKYIDDKDVVVVHRLNNKQNT